MPFSLTRRDVMASCVLAGVTGAVTARAQSLRPISVGLSSSSFGTAAAPLAKQLGLFEKHGLEAKIISMDSGNAATAALVSRSLDFALSGPGELVAAQGRGLKVVVIANTYGGFSPTLILANDVAAKVGVHPDAPVADRLKALNGSLIASTSATSASTVAFKAAARDAGATIRFTYMAQPAMVAALESGAIQGFLASAPYWAIPVVKGTAVLWISGPKGELPQELTSTTSGNLQVMRDFAEANPELIGNVTAVFNDLAEMIRDHPADVKAVLSKLYPNLDGKTLDLLFASEAPLWENRPLTAQNMVHEIALAKSAGAQLPQIDEVDPGSLLYP